MIKKKVILMLLLACLALFAGASPAVQAQAGDLFFSEYIEGSSNNKALEIYNGTGAVVDLAGYQVEFYFNGSTASGLTIPLAGTVAAGDVFVLAHSSAVADILSQADQTNGGGWFNGDDAVLLTRAGVVVDAIGQVGFDPGSQWGSGLASTADNTLRRLETVCAGDANPSDPFDPALQWTGYDADTFGGLGSHTANCGGGTPAPALALNEIVVSTSGTDPEFLEISGVPGTSLDGVTLLEVQSGGQIDTVLDFSGTVVPADGYWVATSPEAENALGVSGDFSFADNTFTNNPQSYLLVYNFTGESGNDIDTDDDGEVDNGLWSHLLDSVAVIEPGSHLIYSANVLGPDGTNLAPGGYRCPDGDGSWTMHAFGDASAYTAGSANACDSTPPPPAMSLVINELLADPATDLTGDANNDGTREATQDEFVEIVNAGDSPADISDWTLSDGFGLRHVFPAGTVIPANCAVIVFGGGSPTGSFGNTIVQTASTGALGLNNGVDIVTLADASGGLVAAYEYGGEGGSDESLTRDPDITGPEPLVRHSTATGAAGALFSPGTLVDGTSFSGCASTPPPVNACELPATLIHDIQGSGSASPIEGQIVTIQGIVSGDFQGGDGDEFNSDLDGFYVLEERSDFDALPETSEGIFVFAPGAQDVQQGDLVSVVGTVDEFFGMTELTAVSAVQVCGTAGVPEPVEVLDVDVDELERFEGMLVEFPQNLVISEYFNFDRYGEVVLCEVPEGYDRLFQPTAVAEPGSPEALALAEYNRENCLTLDDARSTQNPDPARHPNGLEFTLDNRFRGGDILQNTTGILDYRFSLYRIQPTQGAEYLSENPRSAAPDPVGGNIQVASFNVLNYFTTLNSRGADTPEEFQRQQAKIVAALAAIDADVYGLIEIENNDEAVANLVNALNDEVGAGTYDYITTGPIGTDEIKQAILYKPATVSPVGDYAVLDTPEFTDPNDTGSPKNRPALAQSFIDNETGGIFTVVVNHLKSKGSGCGDGDDDPVQGNCNLTRALAADYLVDWLATDPTGVADDDYLIIGDLNAYDKEDPIDQIREGADDILGTADDYLDLIFQFEGEYAYSYLFDGQFGYLDYAMANLDLVPEVTGTTVWHINADEPDILDYDMSFKQDAQDALYAVNPYRSSDHDPVIVGLDVCDEIAPTASVTVSPDRLWAPNHQLVEIRATVTAADNFDTDLTVELLSITSNEPDNGTGDGDTTNDIVIDPDNPFEFQLRAERSGEGEGRIYTITYLITDDCGNSTTAEATVTVPVSHSGG